MSRALGRYELLRPLARGGMAEVFVARRRAAGVEKVLVVKRIRPERAGDARFLALFVREARLSMALAHQNIVPVFDFGRAGEQVFLAMERVEGRDLGSTLERGGPPPPLVAAFVAAECCQALAYAHGRRDAAGAPLGVVHRDVTPRNVLVSWSGEVKLTDFGIAALAGDEVGRPVGTPAYMAPEQARGEPVDARADVYAVGLVLRELLTGARARPGADRAALIDAARRGELTPWPAEADPARAALQAIAARATASDPAARFPTAAAMAEALDEAQVAMRAAARGEAPARQLAAWLDAAWGGDRDDAVPSGAGAEELVDDGTIGTGTERSMAVTADELPPPAAPPPPAEVAAPPAAPRRSRALRGLAAGVAVLAAVALMVVPRLRGTGGRAEERQAALDAAPAVALDASQLVALDAGQLVVVDALEPAAVDAAVDAAAPSDARASRTADARTPSGNRTAPLDAAAAPDARAAAALRRVRINARPWALFSVDGEATEHETISTVELTPGPHRVRFRNPQLGVDRTVTIEVPADRDLDHVEDLRR